MTHFTRLFILFTFLLTAAWSANAQVSGDFRSQATGNWGDFTTWEVYDGATWIDAVSGQVPGGTNESDANNVYLEAGFTVTLTVDASCKDLHLNGTQDVVRINTNNNNLNVWGKMRSYTGIAPGTTDGSGTGSGIAGWISTGTTGNIRFRGTTDRTIVEAGELTANSRSAGWNMEFAFDNGITGTCNKTIRCGHLIVTSGILYTGIEEIRPAGDDYTAQPGNGVSGGTCIVKSGATYRTAGIHKNNVTDAGNSLASFIVEAGATLIPNFSGVKISAVTYQLDGTVIYERSGPEYFIVHNCVDAVPITTYTHVTLAGSSTKTLQNNITVNGKLTLAGTASLSLNTYAVTYGSSGELEYQGSTARTTTDSEWPTAGGPINLTINSAYGVTLHASRTIEGQLTLTSGLFILGSNHLTLGENSPSVAGAPSASNMIVTSGSGELRKIFSAAGSYVYPIGETTGTTEYTNAAVTVNSANVLDGTTYVGMRVVDGQHPADAGIAAHNISRYWGLSTNMTNIDYNGNFQYLLNDVINDESYIFSYVYSDETSFASGSPINSVNTSFHRISLANQTAVGFVTGSSFCTINTNTITTPATVQYCATASSLPAFDANAVSAGAVYQWQQSVDAGGWADIASNSTNEDYTEPSILTPGVYRYRRIASDPAFCMALEDISDEITITVLSEVFGNDIGSDETVVSGGDPAMLSQTTSLSGGTGIFSYQWQSSTTQGGPYTNVASSGTSTTYDPPSGITQTTYYVRVVTSGACSSTSNEVTTTVEPTGIHGAQTLAGVSIYPNPASEQLFVDLDLNTYKEVEISILNATGEIVYKNQVNPMSELSIDLSSYSSGIYFVRLLLDGEKSVSYKIVKE